MQSMQTGALLLDGGTLNYFGKPIPINLIVAVVAEIVLVGGAEYYRIINGLVCKLLNLNMVSYTRRADMQVQVVEFNII